MSKKICIAGAGCAGLLMAKELASAGFEVHVYEPADEDGHAAAQGWSDAVELDMLRDAGLPIPDVKGAYFEGASVREDEDAPYGDVGAMYEPHRISPLPVYSPDYGQKAIVPPDFRHIFVDRHAMIRAQTAQAAEAGVKTHYGAKATGLLGVTDGELSDLRIRGLTYERRGESFEEEADLVVDATGQYASLRTKCGPASIGKPFDPSLYPFVYRTVRKYDASRVGESEIPFEEHYKLRVGGGYMFVHFHTDDVIDIGGGVKPPLRPEAAIELAMDTVKKYPAISDHDRRIGKGYNMKSLPPDSLAASGFMVVGQAGAQVVPSQGCGIAAGWSGALLAADVVRNARDFSLENLWKYNYQWMTGRGAHYAALFIKVRNMGGITLEEYNILLKENILNGLSLTHDYQGIFSDFDMDERRRLNRFRAAYPDIAAKWEYIYAQAKRTLAYYLAYPESWDPKEFIAWSERKKDIETIKNM